MYSYKSLIDYRMGFRTFIILIFNKFVEITDNFHVWLFTFYPGITFYWRSQWPLLKRIVVQYTNLARKLE